MLNAIVTLSYNLIVYNSLYLYHNKLADERKDYNY